MLAPYVRGFVRASLAWLTVGALIGLGMVFWPTDHLVYRPAHAHANLLGFLSMFVFGVAYHVIPRFVGRPLEHPRLALWHLWIANIGLALLEAGWLVRPTWSSVGRAALGAGAVTSAVSLGIFVFIIWRATAERPTVIPPADLTGS